MTDPQAIEQSRIVDELCDEFEDAWSRGSRPSIGEFMNAVPEDMRGDVLGKLLAVELELLARTGQWPDEVAYAERFPSDVKIVSAAFDELRAWVQTTDAIVEGVKSRIIQPDQDTARQKAAETKNWTSGSQNGQTSNEVISPQFGRYRVLRKLGQGGMGTVVLAHDTTLDREVALKWPQFDTLNRSETIERFYREARAMATVHHPNLCPIYDVGEEEGRPYLTMAFIDGHSLADEASTKPMHPDNAIRLVRKLALAMQAVHEAGVVHRDLKPSNVMIDVQGEPYITDFGLASRDRTTEADITQSGAVIGSPAYMAPEQVSGIRDAIGPRTDIYALGVILYQLLCGRPPYDGSGLAVLGQIAAGTPPVSPSKLAGIDEPLEAICLQAMAHDANERFSSASELAEALDEVLNRESTTGKHAPKSKLVRQGLLLVGASLLAVVLIVALYNGFSSDPPDFDSHPHVAPQDSHGMDHREDVVVVDPQLLVKHLLPPPPSSSRRSSGEFYDSGQELGGEDSQRTAVGDIDNDGDLDLVVTSFSGTGHVLLNDGAGRFEKGQELGGESSMDVALGDLDGDGDLDAVFVNLFTPGTIWMNDGHGDFTIAPWKLSGDASWEIVLADVDSDADLDAVVANGRVSNRVFRNDGTGRLLDSGQSLGDSTSKGIAVGDLDGDADLDIFSANYFEQPNRVWLNDGKGTFSDSGQALGRAKSHDVALADVDADGDLDAYVANADAPDALWINDGSGFFSLTIPYLHEFASRSVKAADLDGNGILDFMIASGFRGEPIPCQIILGRTGGVGFETHWSLPAAANDVALADFDSDGDIDAFIASVREHPDQVWFNRDIDEPGKSPWPFRFRDSGQELGTASSAEVVLGDLDNDGDLDAVVANHEGGASSVWNNDGTGFFTKGDSLEPPENVFGVALGDLDMDGDLDVFLTDRDGPNRIWFNDSRGQFTLSEQQLGSASSNQVALADFDSDGDLDAWVGNYDPHHDRVWVNDGHGQFHDSGQLLGAGRTYHVQPVDVDTDGDLDVVVGTGSRYANCLWLNDGRAKFTLSERVLSGTVASNGFAVGDLDGDGSLDLYESGWTEADRIWLNDGKGHFIQSQQTGQQMNSRRSQLADFDGDGDLDVFVGNQGFLPNCVQLNDGTGTFVGPAQWLGSSNTMSVALGDLDGDGDMDAFVANTKGQPNRVWLNE